MGANEEWKHKGNIFFWQHTGYHFTGDNDGCASLIGLIYLLEANDVYRTGVARLSPASGRVMAPPNFRKSELPNRLYALEMKLKVDRASDQAKKFLIKENDRKLKLGSTHSKSSGSRSPSFQTRI